MKLDRHQLLEARNLLKLSAFEVAKAVGLERSGLSRIEDGSVASPDLEVLGRLEAHFTALGVTFHESGRVQLRPELIKVAGRHVSQFGLPVGAWRRLKSRRKRTKVLWQQTREGAMLNGSTKFQKQLDQLEREFPASYSISFDQMIERMERDLDSATSEVTAALERMDKSGAQAETCNSATKS